MISMKKDVVNVVISQVQTYILKLSGENEVKMHSVLTFIFICITIQYLLA